ncbi:MAG: RrF2 family transcriptional regulator [Fidelibacterota bacterium]
MLLSKSSEYAIRLVFLILENENQFIRLKNAAETLQIPYYQLAKVANILMRKKILMSKTGPKGGVKTCFDPDQTTMDQIVQSFESGNIFDRCVLGLSVCGSDNPCPVHDYWKDTKQEIISLFTSTTINELIKGKKIGPIETRLFQ